MVELLRRTRQGVQEARRDAVDDGKSDAETRQPQGKGGADLQGTGSGATQAPKESREVLPNQHHEANVQYRDDAKPHHRRDKLEISDHSRQVMARLDQALDHADDAEVRPKIERLKQAYANGELNNPERMAQAAERMLRGDHAPTHRA